ncbi:MAG: LytR family transcriptional regulator [Tissierellia bacterium]|nr:LytR family transcriptional regulator [Tissierellia bacterium]
MRTFWKIFLLSFISFFIAFFLGSQTYIRESKQEMDSRIIEINDENSGKGNSKETKHSKKNGPYTSLSEAFKKSDRINAVVLGMEESRSDTIMVASFSPSTKKVDVISIPRDTYIHRRGYDKAEQRKFNSIYAVHGMGGVKKAVSHILHKAPIHHTIIMDYKGMISIIDAIGGVDIMVPFDMKYRDPTSVPPLNIDIKKGKQTLYGKDALDFLRYRRGNGKDIGYMDGDLGRIRAQQQFLSSFAQKSFSYRLPIVIKNGFNHVKTDIPLKKALAYGREAMGVKGDDFSFLTLPGKPEFRKFNGKLLSYYVYDPEEVEKLLHNIYNIKKTP